MPVKACVTLSYLEISTCCLGEDRLQVHCMVTAVSPLTKDEVAAQLATSVVAGDRVCHTRTFKFVCLIVFEYQPLELR